MVETNENSAMKEEATEYEYNNLAQIEGVRHEVIMDKSVIHHDTLFKIIIIGDTGKTCFCLLIISSFQASESHAYSRD